MNDKVTNQHIQYLEALLARSISFNKCLLTCSSNNPNYGCDCGAIEVISDWDKYKHGRQ
jgi:hypothetical protein